MTTHRGPFLLRNFYVHTVLCGYFWSLECVRPDVQASPEFVRLGMWPLFHPHQQYDPDPDPDPDPTAGKPRDTIQSLAFTSR